MQSSNVKSFRRAITALRATMIQKMRWGSIKMKEKKDWQTLSYSSNRNQSNNAWIGAHKRLSRCLELWLLVGARKIWRSSPMQWVLAPSSKCTASFKTLGLSSKTTIQRYDASLKMNSRNIRNASDRDSKCSCRPPPISCRIASNSTTVKITKQLLQVKICSRSSSCRSKAICLSGSVMGEKSGVAKRWGFCRPHCAAMGLAWVQSHANLAVCGLRGKYCKNWSIWRISPTRVIHR